MSRLEGAYEQVSEQLTSIDRRLDGIDTKIDLFRDTLDKKIDQHFRWMIGMFVTTWLTTIGLYLRH